MVDVSQMHVIMLSFPILRLLGSSRYHGRTVAEVVGILDDSDPFTSFKEVFKVMSHRADTSKAR